MNAKDLLKQTKVEITPETYSLVSLDRIEWSGLLARPELSPRMTSPFMILMDKYEVTLLLDEIDLQTLRPALINARIEGGYRLITFDVELGFTVVGFMAEISRILAAAEIPILALSAFSRDHLLIKQADLSKALKTLGKHVAELC